MRIILALLLCVATAHAATVTGLVSEVTVSVPPSTRIRYEPIEAPFGTPQGLVTSMPKQTNSNSNGWFSMYLHPGVYRVHVGQSLTRPTEGRDILTNWVPDDLNGTYNWLALATNGFRTLTNYYPAVIGVAAGSNTVAVTNNGVVTIHSTATGGPGGAATNAVATIGTNNGSLGSGFTSLTISNGSGATVSGVADGSTALITITADVTSAQLAAAHAYTLAVSNIARMSSNTLRTDLDSAVSYTLAVSNIAYLGSNGLRGDLSSAVAYTLAVSNIAWVGSNTLRTDLSSAIAYSLAISNIAYLGSNGLRSDLTAAIAYTLAVSNISYTASNALRTDIGNLQGATNGITSRANALETQTNNLGSRATSLESQTNSLGTRITDVEANKQPLDAVLTSLSLLSDPNADRLLFWDDSSGNYVHLTLGSNLSITDTTLNASGGAASTNVVVINAEYAATGDLFNTNLVNTASLRVRGMNANNLVMTDANTNAVTIDVTTTDAETLFNYATGLTGNIQDQINSKQHGSAALTNLANNTASTATQILAQAGSGVSVSSNAGVYTVGFSVPLVTNTVYFSAAAMGPTHGSTAEGGTTTAASGFYTNGTRVLDVWDFDDTTNECVQFTHSFGPSFSGLATIHIHWATTNTLNPGLTNIVWEVASEVRNTNAILSGYTWATNKTDRFYSSNSLQITTLPLLTLTGMNPRHEIDFRIRRLGTNASDAAVGDVRLLGAEVRYVRTNFMGGF